MLGTLRPGQNPENPFKGDVDPGGPVREFVRHLVDGLLEYKKRRHVTCLLLARGIGRATTHGLAIGSAKAIYRPLPPGFGELRHSWLRRRPRLRELPHCGYGGVVERTDHPGDIAQRRALASA